MNANNYDTVIIGSGLAGLNLARKLAQAGQKVFIASKEAITEGASKYAQGGVAVVSPLNPEDKLESHIKDTIESGKGLCREEVVREILNQAWDKVNELIKLGVNFDEEFNIEGSHSYKRIMHVGDATGRAIIKPLIDNISRNLNISISQGTEALSLIKSSTEEKIIGVKFGTVSGLEFDIFAKNIVLATGGIAGLYKSSTNPNILTGDGIALAYDAGAKIENLEFVQFHPTVYVSEQKRFLVTEAIRGAGARLKNTKGEYFAEKYHKSAELATRDVVSRAIWTEMKKTESDHVLLDCSSIPLEKLRKDFPNLYKNSLSVGIDLSKEALAVKPAAHYSVGGVKTDIKGQTTIKGLYALGELASNGFHGANRLASNSLLECIVCADLVAENILEDLPEENQSDSAPETEHEYCSDYPGISSFDEINEDKLNLQDVQEIMSKYLGLERRQNGINSAINLLNSLPDSKYKTVALLLAKFAANRKESLGAHFRIDFPRKPKGTIRPSIMSKLLSSQAAASATGANIEQHSSSIRRIIKK